MKSRILQELFYKKTSPVTPYFYSFNILSELIVNAREKMKKSYGRKSLLNKNVLFSTFAKNPVHKIFLKSLCIFLACEKIRFSSLFADGDVSRRGTSATQRQKFHTDDVKSLRNPVRSAGWSTE